MTLLIIILTFFSGFISVIILIPPIIRVANEKKLFDYFEKRKIHKSAIVPLGGVAIFIGFIMNSIIFTHGYTTLTLKYLVAALILIFFIGLKDDLVRISARKKIIIQIIAVIILFGYGNVQITDFQGLFGLHKINTFSSFLVTLFVMLAIINSFNLIDGIDGLASGLGILASIILGIWFFEGGHIQLSVMSFALAGSLAGFFIFNVFGKQNKMFMGDTGSLIIGIIIATLIVKFNQLTVSTDIINIFDSAPVFSFSLVIVPLIDTLRVITIRLMNGKSPFAPDNNHIHHRLLSLYPDHLKVTLILIAANIALIGITLLIDILCKSHTIQFAFLLSLGIILSFIPSHILRRKNAITSLHKRASWSDVPN